MQKETINWSEFTIKGNKGSEAALQTLQDADGMTSSTRRAALLVRACVRTAAKGPSLKSQPVRFTVQAESLFKQTNVLRVTR